VAPEALVSSQPVDGASSEHSLTFIPPLLAEIVTLTPLWSQLGIQGLPRSQMRRIPDLADSNDVSKHVDLHVCLGFPLYPPYTLPGSLYLETSIPCSPFLTVIGRNTKSLLNEEDQSGLQIPGRLEHHSKWCASPILPFSNSFTVPSVSPHYPKDLCMYSPDLLLVQGTNTLDQMKQRSSDALLDY